MRPWRTRKNRYSIILRRLLPLVELLQEGVAFFYPELACGEPVEPVERASRSLRPSVQTVFWISVHQ